jgi:GxxExxY protein
MQNIFELCDFVRETAYAVHRYLGHGHLEKVYENALAHRLRKAGITVEQQLALVVRDEDGTLIGQYFADLWIDNCLLIELKACKFLAGEHDAQLLGYLKSCNVVHGLLINFGSYKFQIRKLVLSHSVADNKSYP